MKPPTYNAYVTAGAIERDLSTSTGVGRAIRRCREIGVDKVILEGYRGGAIVPGETLRVLRDAFNAEGLATAGGLMPVCGGDVGTPAVGVEVRGGFFCYSSEATRCAIEGEVRKLARLFDEVIIDDALLTPCRCRACDEARAGREWGAFRRELMLAFSRRLVEAAHDEDPDARLVLKLPQYYDRYQRFGYDPRAQGEVFDGVWVGTETRDPATPAYGYVEPYQPWFHVGWVRRCVGGKFQGAWYDYLDCDAQHFWEQAVTTTLTDPGQVTLFCYGEEMFADTDGMARRLAAGRDVLERLSGLARDPVGVAAFRPFGADGDGDLFLFDALGMLGIPLAPVTALDPALDNVIVTAHGATVPDTPERIVEVLHRGGQVIVTLAALSRMRQFDALMEAFGYEASGVGVIPSLAEGLVVGDEAVDLPSPCRIAGDLSPRDAEVPVRAIVGACEGGPLHVPLATVRRHDTGARAVVWNVGGCRHDEFPINERLNVPVRSGLLDLPQPAADVLRSLALAPMGVRLRAPTRTAAFLFERSMVLVNYADAPATVTFEGLSPRADQVVSDRAGNYVTDHAALLSPRSFLAAPLSGPIGKR